MKGPDPAHVPYLPVKGRLYWVSTILFQPPDKHDRRPFVVVWVPATTLGRISVVSRTSDTTREGVPHDADTSLGLNKNGVFDRLNSTEAQYWTPHNVEPCGDLPEDLLQAILDRWYS